MSRLLRLRRTDDGASAVEFALLFPLFAMLAFGTIAAGFAFARQINITQAAREASRFGSTMSLSASASGGSGTITTWMQTVDAATTSAAGNGVFDGYTSRCIEYVVGSTKWYSLNGGTPQQITAGSNCPGATSTNLTNYVQVVLTRTTDFNYILADPTLTLSSVSTTPYEASTT
jgi:Flp pilus assembly protein TadG